MERLPSVLRVRDALEAETGVRYDCVLLNLYPDGRSGMRYHHDPDQGRLWGFHTAVVSVGETRRFCFRPTRGGHEAGGKTHIYTVFDGDIVHMFDHCQADYQHSVRQAEKAGIAESGARASLVFKQTLGVTQLTPERAAEDAPREGGGVVD